QFICRAIGVKLEDSSLRRGDMKRLSKRPKILANQAALNGAERGKAPDLTTTIPTYVPLQPIRAQHFGVFLRILLIFFLPLFTVCAATGEELSNSALQQIQALERDKDARTPAQEKMDSQLIYASKESWQGMVSYDAPDLRSEMRSEEDGRVL